MGSMLCLFDVSLKHLRGQWGYVCINLGTNFGIGPYFGFTCLSLDAQGLAFGAHREAQTHFCPSQGVAFGGPNRRFAGLGAFVKTSVSRETELNPEGLGPPRSKPGGYQILDVVLEGDRSGV